METKRLTIFSGHYGSGKTNVAVNFSIMLKKSVKNVSIYDLDIVNPYFRTVDALKTLNDNGVELVVSPFAETNVDLPAMNAKSYKMLEKSAGYAVVDLGGDDRGALAMGRFSDKIKEENDYDMLLVVNVYRPETRTVEGILEIMSEIERVSEISFTGIVNNSNIGLETTAENVYNSIDILDELSSVTGLPVKFTCVRRGLDVDEKLLKNKILPIDLIEYGSWL
ncbi:MAG: hypothetical protein E7369_05520 [Clostridiales bacterium]|nr:hypothetical protein [Clostridiales bacterium]